MVSKIKSRTIIVLFTLAAMSAASVYVFQNKASAAGLKGSIFTTTFDGQTVNENSYSSKDAVYISGGPQNTNSNGLPDGTYYFQVTDDPGGYWEQTAPLPNDEGIRSYSGTVTGDQSGFNFGNACFRTDSSGNAFLSATPCSVSYPPAPPTPTPTPSPTPNNQ